MQKLNDLRAARAKAITDAEAILLKAEAEARDLTPEEITAVDALVGTETGGGMVASFDEQIARYARVSTLKANLAEPASGPGAIKPEATTKNSMKRSEYEKLSTRDRAAYIQSGGKVED